MNPLLSQCREAWMALEPFRARRRRCKRAAYSTNGSSPNNLVRQLLKSVVGRYRFLRTGSRVDLDADVRAELDLDAASLEEFLISGMTVNRKRLPFSGITQGAHSFVNVSPQRLFFTRFCQPDGADASFFGMLHDFSPSRLLQLFAHRDAPTARLLLSHFSSLSSTVSALSSSSTHQLTLSSTPCSESAIDFDSPDMPGNIRVIEVWQELTLHSLHIHDLLHAEYIILPYCDESADAVAQLHRQRLDSSLPGVAAALSTAKAWKHSWLLPDGFVIESETVAPEAFPFVMRLYPMTDGETHSLVEDVLPQQEHINRLVEMLDRVIRQSAKGVLLFPTEQLPDGFSWQDMRRIWADPGGIIPYRSTVRGIQPQQINSVGWHQGAAEMLKTQLDLFAEVSGMAPSFRGREAKFAGSEAARIDSQNASIALLDLMAAFHAFVAQRKSKV